ncbi:hypothetical protein P170DRAFT_166433 [Aspergillus steynii IBT 23096]|uniref:Uncharacterized protein n=1 Tax=Aspergillus steynii IBT 23096 TaxID=1392250 RepID=A0A2I2G6Z1_9EURO|nr:uncharacterized protein P170DRAFT_166433 [Aspergillus steynii IBT 23096]PLB48644.1 hypothetical protein P170DRAFT_166433 [Aspergillus steynii IBT 23096]
MARLQWYIGRTKGRGSPLAASASGSMVSSGRWEWLQLLQSSQLMVYFALYSGCGGSRQDSTSCDAPRERVPALPICARAGSEILRW